MWLSAIDRPVLEHCFVKTEEANQEADDRTKQKAEYVKWIRDRFHETRQRPTLLGQILKEIHQIHYKSETLNEFPIEMIKCW